MYALNKMRMNLNFHHRHYAKCTKCHKIHTDNQQRTNIKLSDEKTSGGFVDTLNDEEDMKKDIDAETGGNTEKELDEHCCSYGTRPFSSNRYEIRRTNQKPPINSNRNMSHGYRSINLNHNKASHICLDAAITSPLEKLKELQKQRASSDNYYSQEIQKIIGKYFMTSYDSDKNHRIKNFERDRRIKTADTEELEQCGVITTIIRLDCGCVQKTRRPIYTPCIADTHKTHYHHCTDGEIDADADTIVSKSPFSSPTRYSEKPILFDHPPRRPRKDITTESTMQHMTPNLDATDFRHSTLKSDIPKFLRDSFHRRSTS